MKRALLKSALAVIASSTAGAQARAAAEGRAASLEREIASREDELARLKRRVDGASTGLAELERLTALAPLESARKAFDLQLVAPPPPVAPRVGPSLLLLGAAGMLAGAFLGALVILSRPE